MRIQDTNRSGSFISALTPWHSGQGVCVGGGTSVVTRAGRRYWRMFLRLPLVERSQRVRLYPPAELTR
ncbi:MAG: hypothetical protein WCF57_16785 [Pyrinomonadaceae bacterium]